MVGLAVLIALVVAMLPRAAAAQEPPGPGDDNVPVDEDVTAAVADGGRADFWAVMEDRADLGDAASIADWAERGQYVYDRLTSTASESQADLVADLEARGVEYDTFWARNAVLVRAGDEATLDVVRNDPEVRVVEATRTWEVPEPIEAPEAPVVPNAVEWGIADIQADRVWAELGVRGEGVVVANIDTGVDYTHPALVGRYRGNNGDGTFSHDYNWYDPYGDQCATEPCDYDGHGTHTMGTMVGDDGAGNQVGVAPGAQWIGANGCPYGSCPDYDLLTSAEFVMAPFDLAGQNPRPDLRAHIVNNSWGSGNGPFEDPFFADAVDAWNAAGIFGVFANGNHGPDCDTAGSPADDSDAYAVGAYDASGTIAYFSSRGPAGEAPDEYVKPDIAAPGDNVRSSLPGGQYGWLSGTSMAAPHVTGAVALMWSASPATFGDIEATRDLLDGTAVDVDDPTCGGTADDNATYGEGRLDALAAVDATPRGPTGTLTGTVIDAVTSDPIAGATVTVTVEGRPRTTRSVPDGVYRTTVPVGTFDVVASAPQYRPQAGRVEVTEGGTTTFAFALSPLPHLVGTVTDANDGTPVAGALVTATRESDERSAVTGADGTYDLVLETGTWTVTVEADGYATATEEVVLDQDGQRLTLDVALAAGLGAVDPTAIEEVLLPGEQRTQEVTLSNVGSGPLAWEALERGGATVAGTLEREDAPAAVADAVARARRNDPPEGAAPVNRPAPPGPSTATWSPEVSTAALPNILVYTDDPWHGALTYPEQALQRLGMGYTAFYGGYFDGFEQALRDGDWDLVIFADDYYYPTTTVLDALDAYVTGGGSLIAHTWQVEGYASHPLWGHLGATFQGADPDPPDPIHFWDPDHAVFNQPQSVPELTELQSGRYYVSGQGFEPLPGAEALAGTTDAPTPGAATLVLANDERTLLRGFMDGVNDADRDADGLADGSELWEDSIVGMDVGFTVDVPWLEVSPDSGTLEAGDSEALDVAIDTTGLEPGAYSATVIIRTDAPRQERLTVDVDLIVTPYRQAVNVGGAAYTDTTDDPWAADQAFDGSWGRESRAPVVSVRRDIVGTEDDPLYRDARSGGVFAYRFDELPAGTYEVELAFAEIERQRPGRRLFDVTADTVPLLVGYDIAEDVGLDTAVTQRFTVEVTDGQLRIRFLERRGYGKPIVNAIRLTHRPDMTG